MSRERLRFTKIAIEALPTPPDGKRVYYFDTKRNNLAICVTGTGKKTFYVYRKVSGVARYIRIGSFPDIKIEQAEREADRINGQISIGLDPMPKKLATTTFFDLFEWYMRHYSTGRKSSSRNDDAAMRNHLGGITRRNATSIKKSELRELHEKIGETSGIYAANRTLALVRVIYNKAIAHEIIDCLNPATGIEMFKTRSRDRRLSPSEIPVFFAAIEADYNEAIKDYVYLSLFTGARQANVLAMRWDEIDWGETTWRIPMTKNGTPQTIPLGANEIEILKRRLKEDEAKSPWVFPAKSKTGHLQEPRKGWERILKRAGIENLRLHDLRRTLASYMVDTGASLPIIGKALNHQSQQTTAIYARLSLDPVRQAKDKAVQAMLGAIKEGE